MPIVKDKDRVAVKIKGMPYSTRYDEIAEFFKAYQYIEKSAILGVDSQGRKNGFGAILFDNHEQAKAAAKELNHQYIRDRYVETTVITYGDYLYFNGPPDDYDDGMTCKLTKYVGPMNQDRALVMRGLPYRIHEADVCQFFQDYNVEKRDVYIEEYRGKRTGSALVIFDHQDTAQAAKKQLNKNEIGGRYIELYDEHDHFMKQICNL